MLTFEDVVAVSALVVLGLLRVTVLVVLRIVLIVVVAIVDGLVCMADADVETL